MKEITKTTVFEYDKDGNLIKKIETIVEKEIHQDINPNFPYNPFQPTWYCNNSKTTCQC